MVVGGDEREDGREREVRVRSSLVRLFLSCSFAREALELTPCSRSQLFYSLFLLPHYLSIISPSLSLSLQRRTCSWTRALEGSMHSRQHAERERRVAECL